MQVVETGAVVAASFAVTRAIRASPLQVDSRVCFVGTICFAVNQQHAVFSTRAA